MDNREKQAYNYFISKGYSPEASAGIVGNLMHESGLRTGAEGDKGLKGGSSFGIAQWREGRYSNLQDFSNKRGSKWNDFNNQLEFVHHELQTTERNTYNKLLKVKTPEEASNVFMRGFERPSKSAIASSGNKRAQNARNLFGGTFTPYNYSNEDSYELEPYVEEKKVGNYVPTDMSSMEGDSSHLQTINLPEEKKEEIQAKKDILNNELAKMAPTQSPMTVAPQQEVEAPVNTYQYLTQSNLFQLD